MRREPGKSAVLLVGTAVLLLGMAGRVTAAVPVIRNLDRVGLQVGGSTVLTIDGDNLLPDPKVVLSVPVARQVVQKQATANRVMIEVTLDKAVTPGLYNLWLANANGVSAPRVVALDALPQRVWETKLDALPVALHGSLAGSGKLATSFAGKAGQSVTAEVESQRVGGKLRPVLHLYDDQGRQLAWAWPTPALGGDARLTATLPADGKYRIEVHDLQYAAAGGNFRLKLGNWQYVDAVFPAAVHRGQSASVELVGSPAGQRVPVSAAGDGSAVPVPWSNPANASGLRPWILVSDLPEVVEKEDGTVQDVVALPAALNGRLAKPGEVDRFRLKVKPGEKLRFEVFADRLGSPMDAVLKVLREKDGALLAQADDSPGSPDPVLDFTVPPDLQAVVVAVEDVNGRGGPNFVYRVVARPADMGPELADFRLSLPEGEMNVAAGATRVVEVGVERRGYTGPVRLIFDGLPPGVRAQGVDVPAGANGALVTFSGTGSPAAALTSLRGASADPKVKITRFARVIGHPLEKRQPWLAQELAVAQTPPEKVPFAAAWGSLPADGQLVAGSTLKVPLTCTPPKDGYGGVRFYLLASHQPARINGQPDTNQMLRKDQGPFLELPVGKNQGEFVVQVPALLPSVPQDLAFRADLLGKDRVQVIAQAFTPVRRFSVLNPLAVRLAVAQVQAPLDAKTGAEVKLAGKVERRGGFKGDVTVSLTGVPPGIAVPSAVVKDGQADFQLVLRFPVNFKPLEINNLEVFATGRFTPTSPVLNKSDPVAAQVKLVSAPAPAPKK